jgi:hypothetical protein
LGTAKFDFVVTIPDDINDADSLGGHAETKDTTIDIAIRLAIENWKTNGGRGFDGFLDYRNFNIAIKLSSGRKIFIPDDIYKEKIHQILHEMNIAHHDSCFKD